VLALRKSVIIAILGCSNVVLKVLLNKLLIPILAQQGIALASTIMYLVTDVLFIIALWRLGVRFSVRLVSIAVTSGALIGLAAVASAKAVALLAWPVGSQLLIGGVMAVVAALLSYRFGHVTEIIGRQYE